MDLPAILQCQKREQRRCRERLGARSHPFHSGTSPWIHLPHCTHKTELAFTIKIQTSHGSTLLLDKSSCVMPLLNITLVFPRLTFKPLLSKGSFHLKNLSLSPSNVSKSGLSHQHTVAHLVHPIWKIRWQHLPPVQKQKVTAQILGASPL